MRILYKIILISLISPSLLAVKFPENRKISDTVKKDVEKVSKLKIDRKYKEFVYNKEFAKQLHLDESKAIKMPKDMFGAGVTIEEVSPETDDRFAEYKVLFHLFVKHNDNYALPKDSWGDWFGASKMQDEIESVIGKNDVSLNQKFIIDYDMISFISNDNLISNENIDDNYYVRAGSLTLSKYQKNVYEKIDYVSFFIGLPEFPKANKNISIWLKKKDAPDYKYSSAGPEIAKYFFNFQIPYSLRKKACTYLQKAYLYKKWNMALDYNGYSLKNISEYGCDNIS